MNTLVAAGAAGADATGPRALVMAAPFNVALREHLTVSPGTTVAEMVAAALPGLTDGDRKNVRVSIGRDVVPAERWRLVRPKPATTVVIRVVPTGDSWRTILAIAVTVAAVAAGQAWLAPSVVAAFGVTGATATFITSAVGLLAGTAAGAMTIGTVPAQPQLAGQT